MWGGDTETRGCDSSVVEEGVRGVPLSMTLRDGSTVLLQANLGVSDLGTRVGEVEECPALVKGCVAERLMRDPASHEGGFSKLASFSRFLGFL